MDARTITRTLAGLRTALGTALFVAPATAGGGWIGRSVDDAGTRMAVRGLGARDVALGIGTLTALERGGDVDGWLEAGAVADLADATAALLARTDRPTSVVLATVAVAGGAAGLGLWLRGRTD